MKRPAELNNLSKLAVAYAARYQSVRMKSARKQRKAGLMSATIRKGVL